MAIFDEKKMEQKPIYPTKRTPSYADWALFNMGKELEESVAGGGGEITVDQEVIAGSENPVAGGAVKTYVDTEVGNVNEVPDSTAADVNKILTVDANGEPNWSTPLTPQVTVDQTVIAGSTNPVAGGAVKSYVDSEIELVDEVPGSVVADAGKVLTVNSSGNAEWQTPSTPQITVDQTVITGSTNPVAGGGVKTYVDTSIGNVKQVPVSTVGGKILTSVTNGDPVWEDISNLTEQTVIAGNLEPVSGSGVKTYVDTSIGNVKQVPTTSVSGKILASGTNGEPEWDDIENFTEQTVIAGNLEPVSGAAVKTYVDTAVGNVNEVPASTTADANKVLTVNSSGTPIWQTPSGVTPTAHTYSTFGELATAIKQHPVSHLQHNNNLALIPIIRDNDVRIYSIFERTIDGNKQRLIGAFIATYNDNSTSINVDYAQINVSSVSTASISLAVNTIILYY